MQLFPAATLSMYLQTLSSDNQRSMRRACSALITLAVAKGQLLLHIILHPMHTVLAKIRSVVPDVPGPLTSLTPAALKFVWHPISGMTPNPSGAGHDGGGAGH